MARHPARGILYFSMDVDIFDDRKIRRILLKCGPMAMAVILRMLCDIYGDAGYYAAANDDFVFDVADGLGVEQALVRAVIEACVDSGLFDKTLYAKHRILTSRRIQENYIAATRRRVTRKMYRAYMLISDDINGVSDDINAVSDDINGVSDVRSTQSKVKQKKEKENKPNTGAVSYAEHVRMTPKEMQTLVKEFGQDGAQRMVEMLDAYKGAHGREYKNDYLAIRSWVVDRWKEKQASPQPPSKQHRESFERPIENCDHLAEDLFADDG